MSCKEENTESVLTITKHKQLTPLIDKENDSNMHKELKKEKMKNITTVIKMLNQRKRSPHFKPTKG